MQYQPFYIPVVNKAFKFVMLLFCHNMSHSSLFMVEITFDTPTSCKNNK